MNHAFDKKLKNAERNQPDLRKAWILMKSYVRNPSCLKANHRLKNFPLYDTRDFFDPIYIFRRPH